MSLNSRRHESHGGQDSMWTSYSDLFLGLSVIFLLLYVVASLRQGTDGIRQALENQQLSKENQDLKQQMSIYESLKKDYLEKSATEEEQDSYNVLMDKLSLLQEEAKEEKVKLRNQAKENEQKEQALNQYQQMIRNIVNRNLLSKAKIKNRDVMIENQDQEISSLESSVAQKQQQIAKDEARISNLEENLDQRVKQLKNAYLAHKISKQKFEEQQAAARSVAEKQIAALREKNEKTSEEIGRLSEQLQSTSGELAATKGTLAKAGQENQRLQQNLKEAQANYQDEVGRMKTDFAAQQAKDKAQFDSQLAKERLGGAQKAAREAQFRADADRKAKDLEGKIAALGDQYRQSQSDLAKARENLNARKNLAAQMKKNFRAAGVNAEVDENTGDVVLGFGNQYFDTGRARLKPEMEKILKETMPVYSNSLFDNPKIVDKIQNVEIIGFASPTYKGKQVDPQSLNPGDRQAVNYNLDLSYDRAKSIFNYVFDQDKMSFKHQQKLYPLVKVSGRSFFGQGKGQDYCAKNDCAKLQKVIIKFTLKD